MDVAIRPLCEHTCLELKTLSRRWVCPWGNKCIAGMPPLTLVAAGVFAGVYFPAENNPTIQVIQLPAPFAQ